MKVILLYLIYKVEFKKEKNPWGRQTFRFHPRKRLIYALLVIFSPIIVLAVGVVGFIASFSGWKSRDFTSYYFGKDEKQTKFNAYKKM